MCCWRCNTPCSAQCSRCKTAFYCGKECQKADKWRHKVDCDAACVKRTCASCQKIAECKRCVSCENVWYCDRECQRNHRTQHKSDCQAKVKSVLSKANEIRSFHQLLRILPRGLGSVYYWGNTPAVDLINLPINEGTNYSKPFNLLLCGVGDPRNMVLSLASLPDCYTEKVTFVLNDICACVLARTVLLLYMLYKGESVMEANLGHRTISKIHRFVILSILKFTQLYYALIYPLLTYAIITRGKTYSTTLQPLTILQKNQLG